MDLIDAAEAVLDSRRRTERHTSTVRNDDLDALRIAVDRYRDDEAAQADRQEARSVGELLDLVTEADMQFAGAARVARQWDALRNAKPAVEEGGEG